MQDRAAFEPHCPACGTLGPPAARFCVQCGERLGGAPLRELRPMTVLFCGIPESGAGRAGAEEQGEMLAAFYHVAARVAEAHGGRLVRFLGDGVLAHFGWPAAQEDDTGRAAAAALAIRDAVAAEVAAEMPLRIRAGLAAGLVMVVETGQDSEQRRISVLGEALNLAARLQSLAEPGAVLVSASVRRQIEGEFETRSCGAQPIRGWAEPVPVWQLLGPGRLRDRLAAEGARLGPLLGRGAPLGSLRACWARAQAGQGGALLVTGEPGIGKSRLVAELVAEAPRDRQLRLFAMQQEGGMVLQPVIRWVGRAAGLQPADAPMQRRRKLARLLGEFGPEDAARVMELMGAAEPAARAEPGTHAEPGARAEPPQRRRARLLRSMVDLLAVAARRRPILLVFEDLHWADPTTVEVLGLAAARCAGLPLLLLATARNGPLPAWAGELPRVALGPLAEPDAAELVRAVAQDVPLPPGTARDILLRAEGVPLFLEELTRSVVEDLAHGTAASGPAFLAEPLARVPASLHASLLARLDRVGGARRVAEAAAVIGREFEPTLLAAILGDSPDALAAQLDRLTEAELLQRQGADRFRFRHALLQGAAVALMPRERCRALHARVALALRDAPEPAAPQRIAHHWTEAGQVREAVEWWRRGAEEALARSAPAEALAQLRRARTLLQGEPGTEARLREELEIELRIGDALLVLHGHGAEETGAAYDRARALSERLPGHPALRTAMHGQWSHAWMRGLIPLSLERAGALLRVAEEGGPGSLAVAWSALAHSQLLAGRFRAAAESAAESLFHHAASDRADRHDLSLQATMVSTRCYHAWARMFLGRTAGLREELDRTRAAATQAEVPFAIANAGYALALFDAEHGAEDAALAGMRAAARLAAAQEIGFIALAADGMAGLLEGRLGDPAAGLASVRRAIAGSQASGLLALLPHFLGIEAELLARAGDPRAGLARLAEAEAAMRERGTLWEEAPLLCRRGDMLAGLGETEAAVATWQAAAAVAAAQEARLFALRAAEPLARHLARSGRAAEGHALLAEALRPFAAIPEPVVLRARAALAAMARPARSDAAEDRSPS